MSTGGDALKRTVLTATSLISLIAGSVMGYAFSYGEVSEITTELNDLTATHETLSDDYSKLNQSYSDLQEAYVRLEEDANRTCILGVYFSPDGECEAKVIEWIEKANYTLHILIYSFTLDSISDALIDAKDRGIEIKIVFEKSQISKYSEYWKLRNAGVSVRNDTNSKSMHHKVMIVDNAVVLSGSFNWSQNGQDNNNENLVIVRDEEVALSYSAEFLNVWEVSA